MALLLIVDDEALFRGGLRRTLERGGHVVVDVGDAAGAREVLEAQPIELVLCDINMPGESGLHLVASIVDEHPDTAVVMLSGIDDPAVAEYALAIGAYGYLVKPIERNEALINVASGLRRRELELSHRRHVQELESKVVSRGSALREALDRLDRSEASARQAEREIVDRLITALTLRSEETGSHIRRVGHCTALLAGSAQAGLGSADHVRLAAMLHDIGKIGVPDALLLKPGPLSRSERRIIERHVVLGHEILADGGSPVLQLGSEIALRHHERWDGTGYPDGLAGEEIPIAGRITAITDVFDALTSDRVYRRAMRPQAATRQMRAERGLQFDPDLLDLFFEHLPEIVEIRAAHPDGHEHAAAHAPPLTT